MKLKIKVTKEILYKSRYCRSDEAGAAAMNCAISLAVRDIFPNAFVGLVLMYFDNNGKRGIGEAVKNHGSTVSFINKFDVSSPEERIKMPEYEFEIEVPESVIEKINIDELKPLLENHPTLELIS